MSRELPEWKGKTDDSAPPPRVMLRIFQNFKGVCPKCTRKLEPGKWQCDHIVALVNGGENRERNLWPLCTTPCHSEKSKNDVAEKARVYRKAAKYVGIKFNKPKIQSRGFASANPQNTASRPIRKWSPYAQSR